MHLAPSAWYARAMLGLPPVRGAARSPLTAYRIRGEGRRAGRRALAIALLAVTALGSGRAAAHPQFALSTVNRYGKLVLQSPSQTRIFFTLMVGDIPAQGLRQQADRNGDGTLDPSEQQALADELRRRISQGVHIYRARDSGEEEIALPWEAAPFRLDSPAVSATAFAFELSATLPADKVGLIAAPRGAEAELRYDDRVELPPVGEIELRVEEGPDMHVAKTQSSVASPAATPAGSAAPQALLFQWYGAPRSSLSDRSVRVRFTAQAQRGLTIERRPRWYWTYWLLLPATALIAALAAALSFRRRR